MLVEFKCFIVPYYDGKGRQMVLAGLILYTGSYKPSTTPINNRQFLSDW